MLFLNPDARIGADAVLRLAQALDDDPSLGIVGPLIRDGDGALDFSQRNFPRLSSTYAQALFLHRVAPGAAWSTSSSAGPRPTRGAPARTGSRGPA